MSLETNGGRDPDEGSRAGVVGTDFFLEASVALVDEITSLNAPRTIAERLPSVSRPQRRVLEDDDLSY